MDRDALEAAVRPKRPTNLSLNQNLHFVEVDNMLADTPKQQVARKLTFNSADEGSVAQEIHVSRIN
jgi:predicted membrane GTPase involved in stress response